MVIIKDLSAKKSNAAPKEPTAKKVEEIKTETPKQSVKILGKINIDDKKGPSKKSNDKETPKKESPSPEKNVHKPEKPAPKADKPAPEPEKEKKTKKEETPVKEEKKPEQPSQKNENKSEKPKHQQQADRSVKKEKSPARKAAGYDIVSANIR